MRDGTLERLAPRPVEPEAVQAAVERPRSLEPPIVGCYVRRPLPEPVVGEHEAVVADGNSKHKKTGGE